MQIIPISDLKNTVDIEKRCATGDVVYVTKNGYGKLVIMDIDHYEQTIRKMYEAKLVNESLADINNGAALVDASEVKQRITARYGG
jgi:prevent-host-death family protein